MKNMFKIAMMATVLAFSGVASASNSTETLPQDNLAQQLKLTPEQMKTVRHCAKMHKKRSVRLILML
jgi:hypothetical protein